MELLTEVEMREIAHKTTSHLERRIACTALDWRLLRDAIAVLLGVSAAMPDEALMGALGDRLARLRELEATTTAATIRDVHKALGAAPGQSVVARAVEVMEKLQRPGNLGEILGWTGEESLASAAVRVVGERDVARRERDEALAKEMCVDVGEPEPQVFRIIPRVTVDRGAVRFDVVTTDPGVLALTADQLSRLGLVVLRG